MSGDDPNALGRIALKQVRVSRAEVEARNREQSSGARSKSANPRNRLVPYLDLFCRLSDDELSRLARAPVNAVEGLRQQIEEVNRALGRFADLLPRLTDDELGRLTGASVKTIRFWRLSQPRHLQGDSRRTNPDLTPTPQPLPRREASVHTTPSTSSNASVNTASSSSDSESSASGSSSSSSSSSSGSRRESKTGPYGSAPTLTDEPEDSGTFIIDTVE